MINLTEIAAREKKRAAQLETAVLRASLFLQSQAQINVRENKTLTRRWRGKSKAGLILTGALLNSIKSTYEKTATGYLIRLGSYGVKYARMHEEGGTIYPKKKGGRLAIPIAKWAQGRMARDVPNLVRIGPWLVDSTKMPKRNYGKIPENAIGFVLARKAVIPARPFLWPAIARSNAKIVQIFREAFNVGD
jgi:phage gpG-like protein